MTGSSIGSTDAGTAAARLGSAARAPAGHAWRRPVAAVLAVVAVGALALLRAGALRHPPPGLPDAGLLTAWGLPASRFAADVAGTVTVGLLIGAVVLLPGSGGRAAARWAGVWAVAVGLELVFTHSDIRGLPLPQALTGQLASFPQEQALAAQIVLALLTFTLAIRVPRAALLTASCAVLLPLATGHSGATSHTLAVPALVVHVAAATVWAGGLLALVWIGRRAADQLPPAAERFSGLALGCFLATAASGAANALLRLHSAADLLTSAYGQLMLAKSVALLCLGFCGLRHRQATLPRLHTGEGAAAFRRLAAVELLIMAATFAIAVALARTAPPGS